MSDTVVTPKIRPVAQPAAGIDEVPKPFPAGGLWPLRVAFIGAQLTLWASVGLIFATVPERLLDGLPKPQARAPRPL